MDTIVVITTGGTIASTSDDNGAKRASAAAGELLSDIEQPTDVAVRAVDLMRVNSAAMTLADLDRVAAAVAEALGDPTTRGVVITHGTDTMEETAMLVDLQHRDARPVVFTGAQRSHDLPEPDGPANLADALAVAASPEARDLGTLICFAGGIHQARGTRKVHNSATAAFADPDRPPIGAVTDGEVFIEDRRPRSRTHERVEIARTRVDTIALHPGADRTMIDAAVAAGASGIVLEAPGTGNAGPAVTEAVQEHVAAGGAVVLSTRVHAGEVRAVYGGGGGAVDLVAAGAVLSASLRPSQARILLLVLLAGGAGHAEVTDAFSDATSPPTG